MLNVDNIRISCAHTPIIAKAKFEVPRNSVTALIGPSGVGKSTILRSINRLLEEEDGFDVQGLIQLEGVDIRGSSTSKHELRRKIGMVFQKPVIFPISIAKNVAFGAKHVINLKKSQTSELIEKCLKDAFLWDEVKDRLQDNALKLSVGQQQRLAIARTLAVSPKMILMDEPTSSLDEEAAEKIYLLIENLRLTKTILLVTHDRQQAERLSDQVIKVVPGTHGASALQ